MAKPVVDRIENRLSGKAKVVRLDLLSRVGRQAATRYGVRGIPTMVVLDGQGQVTFGQYGLPLADKIVAQVDMLLATN